MERFEIREGQMWRRPDGTHWVVSAVGDKSVTLTRGFPVDYLDLPLEVLRDQQWSLSLPDQGT